jgi:hypothetical protein
MRDVMQSFNWPLDIKHYRRADSTLRRAVSAGDLQVCGTVRHEQAKRPVAVYVVAPTSGAVVPLASALRMWA